MQYIKGNNVENLLKTRKLDSLEAKRFLATVLIIIGEFHKYGFIHRDIKPNNMILSDDGRLQLVDFGSVKIQNKSLHKEFLNRKSKTSPLPSANNLEYLSGPSSYNKNSLDIGNTWVGTEAYQSPEVKNSLEPGYQSDM